MSDLHVYDTTLRDGAQQEGLNLSVADKLAIAMHLDELGGGASELACLDAVELRAARTIVDRYADLQIGLADASNVVLAQRFGQTSIATLDCRHFSVLRALDGSALTLVP